MNRYIFLGKDHPYQFDDNGKLLGVENEVFVSQKLIPISRFSSLEEELFETYYKKK
jgi:hypothetical protein